MRARKQRELGGLAVFCLLIWIIIGTPKRVNFNLTAATAGFTTTMTTKTHFCKPKIHWYMTTTNGTVIQEKESQQVDILMERNISDYSIPLRETPATMFQTLVAKCSAQREDMKLPVTERPRRLLSRGTMLFQPWDVWIGHTHRDRQDTAYYARKDKENHESAKLEFKDSAPQAYHRIGLNHYHQAEQRTKEEILFDSNTAGMRQASAANGTVTQDVDPARLDEKASTDKIAGGSTWECLQLRLPWDVWIGHASNMQKGEVYTAQKDREVRSSKARFQHGATQPPAEQWNEFDLPWRWEAGTPRPPRHSTPE